MSAKAILKQSREAINTKNYSQALKLSKSILRDDKNNYVALVYAALSSQELGSQQDAENYYIQATNLMPSNNLAWQGLVNLYDKCLENSESSPSLVLKLMKVYLKQIEIDSSDEKVLKIITKINNPLLYISFSDIVDTLHICLKLDTLSSQVKQNIQQSILKVLGANKITEEYYDLFENTYKALGNDILTEKDHLEYLKILYAKEDFQVLFEHLMTMNDNYLSIADWKCDILNKFYVLQNDNCKILLEQMKMSKGWMELDSKFSSLTKSIFDIDSNGYTLEVKEALENVVQKYPYFFSALIVLTECYIALQFKEEAIQTILTARNILIPKSNIKYQEKVDLLTCYCLARSMKADELQMSIEIGEKIVKESSNTGVLCSLITAFLQLKNVESANSILYKLDASSEAYHLMKALVLIEEDKKSSAIEELEKNVQNTCEYWLTLGDLYWDADNNNSLIAYLKATKTSPNLFICYQRLGRYYQKVDDLDKAKRCYEKSIKIKSTKVVCLQLSNIYRKLQKWDENLSLLLTLTAGNIKIENTWAFFQLGIHYYECKDFINALTVLRLVIRLEPDNTFCWECIGDCYFASGAYTSALKCYQKVKAINRQALYPMLQIANIKKLLSELVEAQKEFELILKTDPNYIPALKGAAETCYLIAKQHYVRQLYGLTRDALQNSLNFSSRALHLKSTLSCCWKIAADCCYTASLLPFKYAFLSISGLINTSDDEDSCPISEELLKYSIQLYCKTLSLNHDNIYIYHDLACCYAQYAKLTMDKKEKENFLTHALSLIQHCVNNNSAHARHWNLLGCIVFNLAKMMELSQHAFIKALSIDPNYATSWTNLGTLYLCLKELKLANSVFSYAQKSNPNYVNCWIGQALIAEASNMDEAMDLFRHTMELSYHPEGTVGYAHWVCKTLMTKRKDEVIYEIDNMHAIPVACDGLRWYVENNPYDACGWNMFGILSERLGLIHDAKTAYAKAAKYSGKAEALTNLGRTLYSLGEYRNALECYKRIPEKNVNCQIGYALALFKEKYYEESYKAYETALQSEHHGKNIQSDLLVALGCLNYMFGGPGPTKDLLFQSTQLESRSPWSLYAVLSLGLLHDDLTLATLTLNEIKNQSVNEENLGHYANLLVHTHLLQGKYQTAVSQLSALIHKYPDCASLWLALSVLLYRIRDVKPKNKVIVKCAQASSQLKGSISNLSTVLPMVTATSILSGDLRNAVKTAQRQVHYFPNDSNAYQILRLSVNAL